MENPVTESTRREFWSNVDIRGEDECWEWTGGKSGNGYGNFMQNGDYIGAHRMAYLIAEGEPPEPQANHHCDNRSCVNPNHIYAGTQKENIRDAMERGRFPLTGAVTTDQTGENNGGSRLTAAEAKLIWELKDEYTQYELADMFDVSRSNISVIHRGLSWTHVTGADGGEA